MASRLFNFQLDDENRKALAFLPTMEDDCKDMTSLLNKLIREYGKKRKKQLGIEGDWPKATVSKGGRKKSLQ